VQGIYLHIWGNTLAFIGVAICTVLGEQAPDTLWIGVVGAIAVAVIIAGCALPLLWVSTNVLLRSHSTSLPRVVDALQRIPGVHDVSSAKLWSLPSGEQIATIRLFTMNGIVSEAIIKAAREEVASAGYKRARTVVEVEIAEHGGHRRITSSVRLNMAELGSSSHRRSTSSSKLSLVGELEAEA